MKQKLTALVLTSIMSTGMFMMAACGNDAATTADTTVATEVAAETEATIETEAILETETTAETEVSAEALADGVYQVNFDTDSSMFHVNEACEGKGTLTVANGEMMLHIVMPSKNVVNLFAGVVADAEKDGAELIAPILEEVTYSDGTTEEVNAFDVPVTVIGEEFDLALIGTKGKWYDHKVSVSDPVAVEE